MSVSQSEAAFQDALEGLRRGDFSRLDPLFDRISDSPPQIVEWVDRGRFRGQDQELAEALTCACFNGRTEVAEYLLNRGITASGGADTGLNATHWAVNRGQLAIVGLLIHLFAIKSPLESRSIVWRYCVGYRSLVRDQ